MQGVLDEKEQTIIDFETECLDLKKRLAELKIDADSRQLSYREERRKLERQHAEMADEVC
jgi:hypothetical protein